MKKLFLSACFVLTAAAAAQAQEEPSLRRDGVAAGMASTTPEMWFYEQERNRYENPQSAVRRKSESRAASRQQRLAAMKWYGQSNSRPRANSEPYHGSYSPSWVSSGADPYRWRSSGSQVIVAEKPSGRTY